MLRVLVCQYIIDHVVLVANPYGDWNESLLVNEDLTQDINLHLQELGKDITAEKVVNLLASLEIRAKHGITRTISVRTARCYLRALGYHYTQPAKDVVWDRDKVFIPKIKKLRDRMQIFDKDGNPIDSVRPDGKRVVLWFHNKSIFYAHDRRRKTWYHKDAAAKPYQKGEGASLMIVDFFSADFGWLQSLDGTRSAHRVFKPGKNRDRYFTDEIIDQVNDAMDILTEFEEDIEHIFIYDNATTHKKCADNEISACNMPKNTPAAGKNWLVDAILRDEQDMPVKNPDGSHSKVKVRMKDAVFNGMLQPLYFPEGHPRAGVFKGMTVILEERGYSHARNLHFECPSFKCPPLAVDCCCHRLLFNQPDFSNVKSRLETKCEAHGFQVIFLPKFHCELNPIEQCWGYAKRLYRLNPESSREDALEKKALDAINTIPLPSMHRFVNWSLRFMDAYARRLNGRQAAWAAHRYRGHRVLPDSILDELERENID
ncbi:hypothetical protein ARMGADRAFT_1045736 [Armillaria gallica]|uniref:Tc1-like transposase DDE domain-containing protein n=1 Tax=Armillaria gallica TaxID=47427 RepID=A0A2H3DTY8_ARMGA|nr:hypothetical protein ARMGADRAFT_1045736 [Armillaria gallica]